ncbi:glycosyltransferase family 2 protein [Flavobacterium tegetincola]|uniref:glycosyltransferase family 2 protein n=1 Tax=Flavobacterium tegetincola TaxID=150172 RepID=UPI00041B0BC7|nr:glycosyltransferase [Flavobacterium tegetincola]
MINKKESVVVSVVMITYNQQQYIKQAVEGVLMQQIKDFQVELIIADDHSTDETEQIVKDCIVNHPNGSWIQYTKHKVNKGVIGNSIWALTQAKGKYMAICEGDDYWTDPLKLQKQATFMELHPENALCFHSVQLVNEMTKSTQPEVAAQDRNYDIDELLLSKILHTTSFLFRREYLMSKKLLSKAVFGLDGFLVLLMAEKGKMYGISDNMAVYRIHQAGISNSEARTKGILHQKRFIRQYVFFKKSFQSLPKKAINAKIVDYCMIVAKYYFKKWNPQAIFYLILAIYYRPDLIFKGFKKIVK